MSKYGRLWWLIGSLATAAQALTVTDYAQIHAHGYAYCSPRPQSPYVVRETSIIVRFAEADPKMLKNLAAFIQVRGSDSGPHLGTTRIASDENTVLFQPYQKFSSHEEVTVTLEPHGPTDRPTEWPSLLFPCYVRGHPWFRE